MRHIYPEFYWDFRCLASSCPDSCCADWAVVVDDEAVRRYACVTGELGDKLRRCMVTDEDGDRVFIMENDRCPFWDEDGLCRIQRELGEEGLCETCRKFPRLTQDYGSFIEYGLTIACPEAARLILTRESPRKFIFVTDDTPEEETELDIPFLEELERARRCLLEELWDGSCREEEALTVCLYHARWYQDCFDGLAPEPWDKDQVLAKQTAGREDDTIKRLIALHRELELLTPVWGELLAEAENWSAPLPKLPETGMVRNLAEEYLCRYWLQSVNDYDCLSPMELLAVNWLVVRCLAQIHLAKTGELSRETLLRLFRLYAKEVEHDEVNREMLLDALADEPELWKFSGLAAFRDTNRGRID